MYRIPRICQQLKQNDPVTFKCNSVNLTRFPDFRYHNYYNFIILIIFPFIFKISGKITDKVKHHENECCIIFFNIFFHLVKCLQNDLLLQSLNFTIKFLLCYDTISLSIAYSGDMPITEAKWPCYLNIFHFQSADMSITEAKWACYLWTE